MAVWQITVYLEVPVIPTEILVLRGRVLFQIQSMHLSGSIGFPVPETNTGGVGLYRLHRKRRFDPWLRQITPRSTSIQLLPLSWELCGVTCS